MAFGTPVRLKTFSIDATGQTTIGGSSAKLISSAAIGDLVVVEVGFGIASTPATITATDSQGNLYHLDTQADTLTGSTPHVYIFSSVITTALVSGVDFLTITFSTAVNSPMYVAHKTTPPVGAVVSLDRTNSAIGTSASPSAGSITTTGDDFAYEAITYPTGAPAPFAAGSGWTLADLGNVTSVKRNISATQIVPSPSTIAGDGTLAASADWAMAVASYKAFLPVVSTDIPNLAPRPIVLGQFA